MYRSQVEIYTSVVSHKLIPHGWIYTEWENFALKRILKWETEGESAFPFMCYRGNASHY
jgi:hypothetical protein